METRENMDQHQFDEVIRAVVRRTGSRRQTLRELRGLFLGGLLGGAAARLGLIEVTQAKPKRHGAGRKRKSHDDRKAHQPARGAQAAGKRKGKGKGKAKPRDRTPSPPPPPSPPSPPPPPSSCDYPCADGTCPTPGQCCAGERRCVEPESPTGFSCIDPSGCCPDEKRCGAGCIYRRACCRAERAQCGPCDEGYCDSQGNFHCSGTCCPNEKSCPDGSCVARSACCPGQRRCSNGSCISEGCCQGEHECPGGVCYPVGTCCLGEKKCPDGECIDKNACCPSEAPPVCGECEVARCVAGSWDCWPDGTCGPRCGEGYCPSAPIMVCRDPGVCCGLLEGDTIISCFCANGYSQCPSGHCCRTGCCGSRCCEASPA